MAKLVYVGGPGPSVEYPLLASKTVVGRSPERDIYLAHDSVSRRHAELERVGDQYQVTDLGSTNGTFLGERRIRRALLTDGEKLVIGELKFVFSNENVDGIRQRTGLFQGVGKFLERMSDPLGEPGSADLDLANSADTPMETFLERLQGRSSKWEAAYRQLTVLYRIAYVLQENEPVESKLDQVVQLAIATLHAERGFLFEYDLAADELGSRVAYSKSGQDGGTHLDWVRAVVRRVIDVAEPMASGPQLSVGSTMTRPPSGRVFLAAPVTSPRGVRGCLYLDAQNDQVGWRGEDLEFVRTMAAQVGSTLDQSEYAASLIEASEMARELTIARRIQQGLNPAALQVGDGVRAHGRSVPSKEVGGDYYDCFQTNAGATCWLIADVSGKGVPAALVQAQVRSHLRALSLRDMPPHEILQDLNASLLADYAGRMYVTCVVGTVDPVAGKLKYVNAGHEYPHLIKREGQVEVIEAGDHPCGLFEGVPFHVHEIDIEPGDTLLLATDGIVDTQNTQGDRYGPERLRELLKGCAQLSGLDLVETVFRATEEWGRGAPQRDDATLLALSFPD